MTREVYYTGQGSEAYEGYPARFCLNEEPEPVWEIAVQDVGNEKDFIVLTRNDLEYMLDKIDACILAGIFSDDIYDSEDELDGT